MSTYVLTIACKYLGDGPRLVKNTILLQPPPPPLKVVHTSQLTSCTLLSPATVIKERNTSACRLIHQMTLELLASSLSC